MPTILFKGKTFVQNHHLAVPYHQLVPQKDKSLTDKVSLHDNLIVHGDNLLALKALLPTYAGKIKCIYIDPPYNTGNEEWRYNDNVNSPLIKEWLGKIVGKEDEDFTRHDKWLCMMMPRLKLLRELLNDDGFIFISIDDNEQHHLRQLLDEVFGENNYIGTVTVAGNPRARDYGGIARMHDYLMVYSRSEGAELSGIYDADKVFPYQDADGGFELRELRNRNIAFNSGNRPNLYYPFYVNPNKEIDNKLLEISLEPKTGFTEVYPKESQGLNTVWRWGKEKAGKNLNTEIAGKRMVDGGYQIVEKYRKRTKMARSIWSDKDVNTEKGTLLLKDILGKKAFDFPKPVEMLERIIEIATEPNDIVLDSFAGSGTTANAVLLKNNKENDSNRKFILVECEDYADSITGERIRRAIKGVPSAKNELVKSGLGGTFSYFELGDPIETEGILSGNKLPSYLELARYVYYTATGEEFDESKLDESKSFVGASSYYNVYMLYKPDIEYLKQTALTLNLARELREKAGSRPLLVFAPTKYVESGELDELKIDFCQLPFEIYKVGK